MSPSLVLVTPTSGRPEAFSLLQKWVCSQSYAGSILWVITSDDHAGYVFGELPKNITRVVQKTDSAGRNSLAVNLMAAMEYLESQDVYAPILFMEDDDWYHQDYLFYYSKLLAEGAPIVGEMKARYYNVGTRRFRQLGNDRHASMAQTGIQPDQIPLLKQIIATFRDSRMPAIDMALWRESPPPKLLNHPIGVHVSIKGMPGIPGYGIGHRDEFGDPDTWLEVFNRWNLPLEYTLFMEPVIRLKNNPERFAGEADVAIGMMARDMGAMTREAVHSVLDTTRHLRKQFILWDDGSTENEAVAFFDELERLHDPEIRVVRAHQGAGWIRSINYLARFTTAPYFIGLNNDIKCHAGWADELIAPFASDVDLGETGYRPTYGKLDDQMVAHHISGEDNPEYIEGWCFCVPRKVVTMYGPYDECSLKGFYYEDVDLSLRLKATGKKIMTLQRGRVQHLGSATAKADPLATSLQWHDHNRKVLVERFAHAS